MKIKKIVNHRKIRWRVNDPRGANGKRQRKFFETKEDAECFIRQQKADRHAYGIHFTAIPPSERAALGYQLERLRKLGWNLPAAVDFIERHGKIPPSISLGTVAAEFLAAKKNAGLRPRYLWTLRASINRFLINRREKMILEISAAEILEYISRNGWAASTMRSYLVDVRTLFSFAVKRKYLPENPALAVDLPRLDENPPGILSPAQAKGLLDACLDAEPDILPVLILSLFGGIRRAEAEKIEWAEIGAEFIEIKAEKAKTRRRRLIPISAQLRAWLDCSRKIGGKLPAVNYADKLKRTLEKAGLRAEWPQNALRHSFASYHYAKHRNENETAALMGNSPQMIFAHYRELVRPADADAFFRILPPPDARARARAARAARRHLPPRAGKVTEEIISAVFDGGRLMLSRKNAVAALCERSGCKVPTAYLALSANGRFRSQLRETDGSLSWQPFPLVPETSGKTGGNKGNQCIPLPLLPEAEKDFVPQIISNSIQ
jgi:site-specific recombinase XerD